jgi:hypothetical protein
VPISDSSRTGFSASGSPRTSTDAFYPNELAVFGKPLSKYQHLPNFQAHKLFEIAYFTFLLFSE